MTGLLGYHTVLVDPFNGDPIPLNTPEGFEFATWLTKGSTGNNPHTWEFIDPLIAKAIKFMKVELHVKRLGGVGYCFGAKYAVRFLGNNKGIDVGYCAHPVRASFFSTRCHA